MVENSKIMRKAWCDNCNKEVRAYEIDSEWHCNNCHNHVVEICPTDNLPCTPDDCPYTYDCNPATTP